MPISGPVKLVFQTWCPQVGGDFASGDLSSPVHAHAHAHACDVLPRGDASHAVLAELAVATAAHLSISRQPAPHRGGWQEDPARGGREPQKPTPAPGFRASSVPSKRRGPANDPAGGSRGRGGTQPAFPQGEAAPTAGPRQHNTSPGHVPPVGARPPGAAPPPPPPPLSVTTRFL